MDEIGKVAYTVVSLITVVFIGTGLFIGVDYFQDSVDNMAVPQSSVGVMNYGYKSPAKLSFDKGETNFDGTVGRARQLCKIYDIVWIAGEVQGAPINSVSDLDFVDDSTALRIYAHDEGKNAISMTVYSLSSESSAGEESR